MPPEAIKVKITTAIQDYKQIKKTSDCHDIWIAQMITAQAEAKNTEKAKLWKRLRHTKQSCMTARKVKKALGTLTTNMGLSQVTAPTSCMDNTRIAITTKHELETACLKEVRRRFTQAATNSNDANSNGRTTRFGQHGKQHVPTNTQWKL